MVSILLLGTLVLPLVRAATPTECTLTRGDDFVGDDLLQNGTVHPFPCPSFAACCSMCSNKVIHDEPLGACRTWSWNNASRKCYMKDGKGHVTPRAADISGTVHAAANVIPITIDATHVVATTNPTYASWNVDASYNRGFVHIDFTNRNLIAAATSLAPSMVRFGGSGNDYLTYSPDPKAPLCDSKNDSDYFVCLNQSHWDQLYGLAEASGTKFIFGVSYDMSTAQLHGAAYVWNSSNAELQLRSIAKKNQEIFAFELGNEVNNRKVKYNLTAKSQAAAMRALSAVVDTVWPDPKSRPRLIGPDSGYLNPQDWLTAYLDAVAAFDPPMSQPLHAVTHHVYPGVTALTYNDPSVLDRVQTDIAWYSAIIAAHAPKTAQMWAGEDGPTGGGDDGTCGANTACGTYATTLWYADDMGQRSRAGFAQYQRQTLLGGRYGLLGIPHDSESLETHDAVHINPDFWMYVTGQSRRQTPTHLSFFIISTTQHTLPSLSPPPSPNTSQLSRPTSNFLWKRLLGPSVLNASFVNSRNRTLRAYSFCGKAPSPHRAVLGEHSGPQQLGLILINLNSTAPQPTSLSGVAKSYRAWTLEPSVGSAAGVEATPPALERSARLNGVALPTLIADGAAITAIPGAAPKAQDGGVLLSLPPISVTFVRLVPSIATASACA